jgi:signal transduction histidine kinase
MKLAARMTSPDEQGSETPKQMEKELRVAQQSAAEARDLANALLEAADDATLLVADDGGCVDANFAALQLFGFPRAELLARSIGEIICVVDAAQTSNRWAEFARAGKPWIGEVIAINKSAARLPAEIRASKLIAGTNLCVIREKADHLQREGRMRELVEAARQELHLRERIELELKDLNRELERRIEERTAALQESHSDLESFCYSISHDLRAPLRSMQGFAQALVEDHAENLNDEGRDFARRIVAAAQHMDKLLRDVLAFSRLSRQALPPEPVDLDAVIREVCSHHEADVRGRSGQIHVTPCGFRILANRSVVELMLSNLVDNALKFVEKGRAPEVKLHVSQANSHTRIWVRDNGIGISPEHHQRIFRIFERLHGVESFPGTGIGLALVQKAAERMNGSVGVESTPGQGSAFWVELPTAP